jgi:perosamine synthetase
MCLTNNDELASLMRILRNQGIKPEYRNKYYYDMIGFNYRITNMQAAVGVAQLKRLDFLINKKLEMGAIYNEIFKSKSKNIVVPPQMEWAKNVYWYYSILVPKNKRDQVVAALESKEIEVRPFFYPIHMLPHYKSGYSLPVAEDIGFRGLNLPSGAQITQEQIEEVASVIMGITG